MSWDSETGFYGSPAGGNTLSNPNGGGGRLPMPAPESAADLRQRISAALDFVAPAEGREAMRVRNIWLIRETLKTVKPEHLTDDEIAVIVSTLAAAHGRVLLELGVSDPLRIPLAPVLALVRTGDAAAKFADESTDLACQRVGGHAADGHV